MASEANVYSAGVTNQVWFTDKCQIAATSVGVTYQVSLAPNFTDTIYSAAMAIPNGATKEVYVGVGNKLTLTGSYTALEIGTASSGTAGVN